MLLPITLAMSCYRCFVLALHHVFFLLFNSDHYLHLFLALSHSLTVFLFLFSLLHDLFVFLLLPSSGRRKLSSVVVCLLLLSSFGCLPLAFTASFAFAVYCSSVCQSPNVGICLSCILVLRRPSRFQAYHPRLPRMKLLSSSLSSRSSPPFSLTTPQAHSLRRLQAELLVALKSALLVSRLVLIAYRYGRKTIPRSQHIRSNDFQRPRSRCLRP
jgi:hypothetical protein